MTSLARSRRLVDALLAALPGGESAGPPRLVETHISWVILAGDQAWKIKKPVRLDFLDFSTLEARRAACAEEIRLNRRLAPELYHGVVPIAGTVEAPRLAGDGPPVEYAVHMARFPDGAVLGEGALARLEARHVDALAASIAAFHESLPPAVATTPHGVPAEAWDAVASSLATLERVTRGDTAVAAALAATRSFVTTRFARIEALLEVRRRAGRVRECHGDLHLGNLVLLGDRVVPFDALEFDPALRWTDVLAEVAFVVMDLELRGRRDYAFRFLNRYLDATGDHAGLPALPFFTAYRAIVRAKVRALGPDGTTSGARADVLAHLRHAAGPPGGAAPLLVVMSGISGSGKSWLALQLAESLPAVHLRSDVERRRMHGVAPQARTGLGPGQGMYGPAASAAVYERLQDLARAGLAAGLAVIVDATSLRRAHRANLVGVARAAGCPAAIVACHADDAEIARRVAGRAAAASDPSEADAAVAALQRREYEQPACDEADLVLAVDTGRPVEPGAIAAALRATRPLVPSA